MSPLNFKVPLLLWFCFYSLFGSAMTIDSKAWETQRGGGADFEGLLTITEMTFKEHTQWAITWEARARIERIEDTKIEGLQEGHHILLTGIGGSLGEMGVQYSGMVLPSVGASYFSRLKFNKESGTWKPLIFPGSMQPVEASRGFSRNRTDGSDGAGKGAFLYWDDSYFPIPFYIAAETFRGLPHFAKAIRDSFASWSVIEKTKLYFTGLGCSDVTRHANDGLNNIIYIKEGWAFDSSVIAITRNFYISGTSSKAGMILDSDILLNAQHNEFSTQGEAGKHDVQNILTHEIGHMIGLGHEVGTVDSDATMFAVASTGEFKKRTLESNDIEGAISGYLGFSQKNELMDIHCDIGDVSPSCASVGSRSHPQASHSLIFLSSLLGFLIVVPFVGQQLVRHWNSQVI